MRERLPDYDVVASPGNAPVVFAGPPRALTGRVELHNGGDAKVVLRQAGLDNAEGPLAGRTLQPAFPAIVLRPGQGRAVSLRLAVDPATPPGEYRCQLALAGGTRPAVLLVAEEFDLSVTPEQIVVENRPGDVQVKRIIVRNEGNVAFTVGDIGEVVLEDELIWCRAGRVAVQPWMDKDDARLEDLAVAILKAARDEAYRSENLQVRTRGGEVEVAPGETVSIELEVTVPERLHRNSRYRGVTPLFTEDLVFLVVPARGATAGRTDRRGDESPPQPPTDQPS